MERDQQPAKHGRGQADHTICVIPARGGSKTIPLKNLIKLGEYSLLEHTLIDAYPLRCPVYVSSDSDKIGFVAQENGAVFIRRPDNISGDKATTEDAVLHVLERLKMPSEAIVVLLQCTSPFRHPGELENALDYFKMGYCDSMYSAYRLYQFAWTAEERIQDPVGTRPIRQLKQPLYIEDGSFYISRAWCYYEHNNRLAGRIGRWVHYKIYGVEIDTWEDLELCRLHLDWLKSSGRV